MPILSGAAPFELPAVLHVPNGDTPSLQIGNDVWDTDPTNTVMRFTANDDATADLIGSEGLNLSAPSRRVRVVGIAFVVSGASAAPADIQLGNGDFGLWLDATAGATKLMVKAKDVGGTVRTGSLALV